MCGRPVPVRHGCHAALAAPGASVALRHLRRCPGLVDEDELAGIDTQRTALAADTPNRSAASRRDMPPFTAATSRLRRSLDSARVIHAGLQSSGQLESESAPLGNPLPIHSDPNLL